MFFSTIFIELPNSFNVRYSTYTFAQRAPKILQLEVAWKNVFPVFSLTIKGLIKQQKEFKQSITFRRKGCVIKSWIIIEIKFPINLSHWSSFFIPSKFQAGTIFIHLHSDSNNICQITLLLRSSPTFFAKCQTYLGKRELGLDHTENNLIS